MINIAKLFCFLGLHSWYYGNFQTGIRSKLTDDHVGIRGRVCLDCDKKQKSESKKYITIKSFKKEEKNGINKKQARIRKYV